MARIYYREEKIYGTSLISNVLNIDVVNYIIENWCDISSGITQLTDQKESFFDLFRSRNKQKPFRFTIIWDDGFYYNSGDQIGEVYVPKSIVLFDVDDASFPSEYYFIAKIMIR